MMGTMSAGLRTLMIGSKSSPLFSQELMPITTRQPRVLRQLGFSATEAPQYPPGCALG